MAYVEPDIFAIGASGAIASEQVWGHSSEFWNRDSIYKIPFGWGEMASNYVPQMCY